MAELNGKDFRAVRRLSTFDGQVIAEVGETCERVPAGKHGGTASDALERLLASGKIAPVAVTETADAPPAEPAKPSRRRGGQS